MSINIQLIYENFRNIGLGYDEAHNKLQEVCIKEGLYSQYIRYILKQFYQHTENIDTFLEVIRSEQKYQLFKTYWKARLSEEVRHIWELLAYWKNENNKKFITEDLLIYDRKILNENQNKYPAMQDAWLNFVWQWYQTLEFLDRFISEMQKINAEEEIEKAKTIKQSIYNLQKPKPKKTTDKRKMDEILFWDLIETSRNESDINSEFLEVLQNKLEAMSTTEIKKFKKHLLEKMNELYHWDIWALAYIVRGGCGDDAFDYFSAWVVSKGKDVFEMIKNMQTENFKELFFQEDPQLEEFMYVANEAYENKKSEGMSEPRVKSVAISGKEWDEKNICTAYPKLCEIFEKK